jgi:hypothetical protein
MRARGVRHYAWTAIVLSNLLINSCYYDIGYYVVHIYLFLYSIDDTIFSVVTKVEVPLTYKLN